MSRMTDPIAQFEAEHRKLIVANPYCYAEIAYTRATGWMAWLCTNCRDQDPGRKVLACGEGKTMAAACRNALKDRVKRLKRLGALA